MFAQGFLESFWSEGIVFFIRVVATIGGAVVGWLASDPVTRGLYRVSFKGTTPGSLLFASKASGSAILAVIMWVIVPTLFGGGGGLGFGPGLGGQPGKGKDQGGDKVAADGKDKTNKDAKDGKDGPPKADPKREPVKIEILGGPKFKNDGEERYYLVLRKDEPPRSLDELKEYLKNTPPSLIEIVHTDDTFVVNTDEDPTRRLRKLGIPTKGPD